MSTLRYDESALLRGLNDLPERLRSTFAASCAERLMPAYRRFHASTAGGDYDAVRSVLDRVWERLLEGRGDDRLEEDLGACMNALPDQDDEAWSLDHALADDAASALAYAVRSLITGESQEAAWAARRAHEALDHALARRMDADFRQPQMEERILRAPPMQAELARQDRDLAELAEAASAANPTSVVQRLRDRATNEAELFFDAALP